MFDMDFLGYMVCTEEDDKVNKICDKMLAGIPFEDTITKDLAEKVQKEMKRRGYSVDIVPAD